VAESAGDLSVPLCWCYVALRQAERVRESYAEWRAVEAAGEESDQLDFLYWGDARYLISATHHMSKALDGPPSGAVAETTQESNSPDAPDARALE
jgi:hypothetical protein